MRPGRPPDGVHLSPPYEDFLGRASYEVCPNCGFEFGNDDTPAAAHPQRRSLSTEPSGRRKGHRASGTANDLSSATCPIGSRQIRTLAGEAFAAKCSIARVSSGCGAG
jgi:hypothetical protein